jgi:CBS domain-containing membrane protein
LGWNDLTVNSWNALRRALKAAPGRFNLFSPILAGATLRDRLIACLGAVLSIGLTGALSGLAFGQNPHLPLLVAPVGASAVLLFAVPASPLAQPWPIIGGNVISAVVGILVGWLVRDPMIASGLAVAVAIAAMSLARCLHPPGGAAALTAVLAWPSIAAAGFMFPLVPVGVNSLVLVVLGWAFHRFSRHSYPHVAPAPPRNAHGTRDAAPAERTGFTAQDLDAALGDLGETFDIDPGDLDQLLRQVELRAAARAHGDPSCADIMSRDVIAVGPDADLPGAQALLLRHGVRTLPVVDDAGALLGTVGLRELAAPAAAVRAAMAPACTAQAHQPAFSLVERLTDGAAHAVVVVDEAGRVLGMVTQTDLLATFCRSPRAGLDRDAA